LQPSSGPPKALTWNVEYGDYDSVNLVNPADSQLVRLTAVLDGDVLVGRPTSFGSTQSGGPSTDLFVLVRASSGASVADVADNYLVAGEEIDTEDRGPTPGQGLTYLISTLSASISRTGALSVTGLRDTVTHDAQGEPAPVFGQTIPPFTGRVTLRSDGWFTMTDGAVGAFTRSGELFVRTLFDGRHFSFDFGGPITVATAK
jgi:hypothetical protein